MKTEKDEKSEPILTKGKDDYLKKPVEGKKIEPYNMFKNRPPIDKEKDDPLYEAKKRATLRDGILTLIGNECHRIGFGCLMVIHNLTTYLMSYLRHYQEEKTITLQYSYFIGPVMSITMGLFTPTVGMLEHKMGLKLCIILGSILCLWSSVILYFSKNYYMDLFSFFVNSLGSSMMALMSRNLMGYFFNVRGKLSGILSVVGSVVSSAYNIVGEKWIVNPNSEEAIIDHSYYSIEVCQNLLTFLKISWVCIIIGTILTVVFVVPFNPKKHIRLFKPAAMKDFKGFDKEKMNQFRQKDFKKEKIENDDKIGPLIPEENKENNKDENKETNKERNKEDFNNNIEKDEIINIDKEKEIKEEERDKVNPKDITLKVKDKKKKKNDFDKTSSVPAFLVTNKDKLLYDKLINEDPENKEEDNKLKNEPDLKKKRSLSVSYKQHSKMKLPLINMIPEIEVVAVAPPPAKQRQKFNLKLIKKALKSRRVLFLFLMGLFSSPLSNFLMSTWRPLGIRKGIPTKYLQDIGTYRPFITCAATLIFSTLSDYCPFRYLYCIFSVLASIVGFAFCFTLNSPGLFTFIILLNSVVFAGKMSITGPHYMKVFGLKYYIEIGGVIGLSRVFMSPLCTVFIFLFETYIATPTGEVNITPYIILFISTGILNIVPAILCLFETEELFSPE